MNKFLGLVFVAALAATGTVSQQQADSAQADDRGDTETVLLQIGGAGLEAPAGAGR